jgi:uncharacterized BrkB/YihY/UPF0761 family membrane protein
MNPFERAVRTFDDVQKKTPALAVPMGVIRKFADDRTSAWAALMTFYGFLALFPLLVIALTIIGRMAATDPNSKKPSSKGCSVRSRSSGG